MVQVLDNLKGRDTNASANVNGKLGNVSWRPWSQRSESLKRWSTFPALTTQAAYLPNEQLIEIHSFPVSTFDKALDKSVGWADMMAVRPLVAHEIRHWMDHLGTLWGQQRIVSAFNAMNSREAENPEYFYRITEHWQLEQRDHFEDFYSVIGDPNPTSQYHWMARPTCGRRFDLRGRLRKDKPILLVRFQWLDGTLACRAPLSVLALLEAGAMHYEQSARNAVLEKMPAGERAVEESQIRGEVEGVLYNPSLSAYTAATHLVANTFHIKDAVTAFGMASQLAAVSLNLPELEISRMRIAKTYASMSNEMNHLRNSQDRGFAFLNLLHGADTEPDPGQEWLKVRIQKVLVRSSDELESRVRSDMIRLQTNLIPGPHRNRALKLLETGREIFDKVGLFHQSSSGSDILLPSESPTLIFKDGSMRKATGNALAPTEEAQEKDWFDQSFRLQNQMNEFVKVCGV